MAKLISPAPKLAFLNSAGAPAMGYKLYTYEAGSTTLLATYTDSTGNTPNANPIILDARGEASVWISAVQYKYVLKTDADVTVFTVDSIQNDTVPTQYESIVIACSDETTALTTGTAKVTFRMPYAMTVTGVKASLTTAQTSGTIFTVDINDSGTTILSTELTIDNTEKTSPTAATAAVISDTALAADAEITIDIDQIGDSTAKGLKVTLNGYRT